MPSLLRPQILHRRGNTSVKAGENCLCMRSWWGMHPKFYKFWSKIEDVCGCWHGRLRHRWPVCWLLSASTDWVKHLSRYIKMSHIDWHQIDMKDSQYPEQCRGRILIEWPPQSQLPLPPYPLGLGCDWGTYHQAPRTDCLQNQWATWFLSLAIYFTETFKLRLYSINKPHELWLLTS